VYAITYRTRLQNYMKVYMNMAAMTKFRARNEKSTKTIINLM